MREDKQGMTRDVTTIISQIECDRCPNRGGAECKGYACKRWNNGWAVRMVSYDFRGNIDNGAEIVKGGLSFDEISDVLEEIRKETRPRVCGKYKE